MNLGAKIQTYQAVVDKTVAWAHRNHKRLMQEPDIQAHYKAPYFWAAVGDMNMAGVYRSLVSERFLRKDGDFRTRENVKGFGNFPCTVLNQYLYPNGWLVSGLQKAGAYDIAQRGLEFMLRFQDPKSGGFYYGFDARRKKIDSHLMDSSSTCSAGMACLMTGRVAEAAKAGDFMVKLFALQPEPDTYFFSCMRADGKLHTDVFASEDQWDYHSRKQKCLSTKHDGHNELTWLIGKPTKFLTKLYMATGDKQYLKAANFAFMFFHKLHRNAWTNYASCKTMWAGSELYRITGKKIYLETALRILDYYCKTQRPSGAWVHTLWYKTEREQQFTWTSDITHEYGAEISDVIYDLGACV